MTTETLIHLAITAGGWVAMIATMKQQLKGHGDRILNLENCEKEMDERFVPRNEIKALLAGIQNTVESTNRLIRSVARRARRNEGN